MLILRVKNIYKINAFISFYKKKWFYMFIFFINIVKNGKLKRTICKIGVLSQNDPFIKNIYIKDVTTFWAIKLEFLVKIIHLLKKKNIRCNHLLKLS